MVNAKELARQYVAFDGHVTFYMIPWNTILFRSYSSRLETLLGKKNAAFDSVERFFPVAESLTVDIEFEGELTPELQGLQVYWQSRNGDMATNYDNYMRFLSDDVYVAWLTAYGETRDTSIAATPDLATPPPDADAKKKRTATKPAKP